MNVEEWIISILLIGLVIWQIKGRKLTLFSLTWPLILVLYGAFTYLSQVPQYLSDWIFVFFTCCTGLMLGVGCGILTDVYRKNNIILARARILAAFLWIVGMGSRLVFGIFATNGGAEKIGELSIKLDLHSMETWPTALITMALVEVSARSAVLFYKYRKIEKLEGKEGLNKLK